MTNEQLQYAMLQRRSSIYNAFNNMGAYVDPVYLVGGCDDIEDSQEDATPASLDDDSSPSPAPQVVMAPAPQIPVEEEVVEEEPEVHLDPKAELPEYEDEEEETEDGSDVMNVSLSDSDE